MERFSVTKGASTSRRIVCKATNRRTIAYLKRKAHKAIRRYAKDFIRFEGESYSPSPKLTSWDIC